MNTPHPCSTYTCSLESCPQRPNFSVTVFTTHILSKARTNLVIYSFSFLVFISQPKLRAKSCLPLMMSKRNCWQFDCLVVSAHRSTCSHLHCLKAHWQMIHTSYAFTYWPSVLCIVYILYFAGASLSVSSLSLSLSLSHTHTPLYTCHFSILIISNMNYCLNLLLYTHLFIATNSLEETSNLRPWKS